MKYCVKCGTQLDDDALFCHNCGAESTAKPQLQVPSQSNAVQPQTEKVDPNKGLKTAISVLLIIACVVNGIYTLGIALAWCIPMTLTIRKRMNQCVPVGVAMGVCTLLFVNTIAGILLLCLHDENQS